MNLCGSVSVGVGVVLAALVGCGSEEAQTQFVSDPFGNGATDAGSASGGASEMPSPDAGVVANTQPAVGSACSSGQLVACSGENGCVGTRTCNEQTGELSACSCGAAQSFLGELSGDALATPLSMTPSMTMDDSLNPEPTGDVAGGLGDRCQGDADCISGLGCLQASSLDYFGFGGPAGGYCTVPCDGVEVCDSFFLDSLCLRDPNDQSTGLCVRHCTTQAPASGENKCFNRPDVVCNSLAAAGQQTFLGTRQDGFCRPLCASDAECPGERICHPSGGMCVEPESAATGLDIGAFCSVNADCKSAFCENVAPGLSLCAQLCVLGQSGGCGFAEDATNRTASCLTARVKVNRFSEGEGDLGLCREVCNADEDCQHQAEGWLCENLSTLASDFFGVVGACVPPPVAAE